MARPSTRLDARTVAAITSRMEALGWGPADLARATEGQVSYATARKLVRGEADAYADAKLRAVSVALGWPPNGVARVMAGETADAFDRDRRDTAMPAVVDGLADGEGGTIDMDAFVRQLEQIRRSDPAMYETIADLIARTAAALRERVTQ